MKLHRIIITAAALPLAAAPVALASWSGGSSDRTIKGTAIGVGITLVDADHSGKPSVGDYEVAGQVLVNADGKRIGRGQAFCLQVNASGTEYLCQSQYHFAGGVVMTSGPFSVISPTYASAIVGGTGAYAGATGTLSGKWLGKNFERAKIVISLHS